MHKSISTKYPAIKNMFSSMRPYCNACISHYFIVILCSLLLILTIDSQARTVVTPEMFGAIGDGVTDDTDAMLHAIQSPCDLELRNIYWVNNKSNRGTSQFRIPSNKTIYGVGRIISPSTKALFLIHSSRNIKIKNMTIDYSAVTISTSHSPSNHGIVIVNSSDIKVEGVRILSPKGDGIYIGSYNNETNHNNNILISKCYISDFKRQGIAVIEGNEIVIKHCVLTNGINCLYGGIDIEPNHSYEAVNITIKRNSLENCGINTYRADSQLKRNNRIMVVKNNVKKQMHLTGGVGSHFAGISIQDAIYAEVKKNEIEGFVGISIFNCKACSVINNKVHSAYRGVRAASVGELLLKNNVIQQEEFFDFSEDKRLNASLVHETGTTIEAVSSDGEILNNELNGRIWARDCSRVKVEMNKCVGRNGAILLNVNRKGAINGKAIVKRNYCGATGETRPIMVLEGDNRISFEVTNNRYSKASKGLLYPPIGLRRIVTDNYIME